MLPYARSIMTRTGEIIRIPLACKQVLSISRIVYDNHTKIYELEIHLDYPEKKTEGKEICREANKIEAIKK